MTEPISGDDQACAPEQIQEVPISDREDTKIVDTIQPTCPPFSSAMEILEKGLKKFQKSRSDDATYFKKKHRLDAYTAITAGFFAFFLAVSLVCYEALHLETDESILFFIRVLELVLALVALASVVLGYYRKNQQMFLLNRYFSERARIQFFRSLTSENLWGCSSYPDWVDHTEKRIRELKENYDKEVDRIRHESLITYPIHKINILLKREKRPDTLIKEFIRDVKVHNPPHTIPCALSSDACTEFIQYYMLNRLDHQIEYYKPQISDDNSKLKPRLLHKIPHATFFGSIAAVSGHFILDFLGSQYHFISTVLIGIAVVLPFLGVTLRGYTEVFQTVRVIPHYHAKCQALKGYRRRI